MAQQVEHQSLNRVTPGSSLGSSWMVVFICELLLLLKAHHLASIKRNDKENEAQSLKIKIKKIRISTKSSTGDKHDYKVIQQISQYWRRRWRSFRRAEARKHNLDNVNCQETTFNTNILLDHTRYKRRYQADIRKSAT